MANRKAAIKILIDIGDSQKKLSSLSREMEKTSASANRMALAEVAALEKVSQSIDKLDQSISNLNTQMLANSIERTTGAFQGLTNGISGAASSVTSLGVNLAEFGLLSLSVANNVVGLGVTISSVFSQIMRESESVRWAINNLVSRKVVHGILFSVLSDFNNFFKAITSGADKVLSENVKLTLLQGTNLERATQKLFEKRKQALLAKSLDVDDVGETLLSTIKNTVDATDKITFSLINLSLKYNTKILESLVEQQLAELNNYFQGAISKQLKNQNNTFVFRFVDGLRTPGETGTEVAGYVTRQDVSAFTEKVNQRLLVNINSARNSINDILDAIAHEVTHYASSFFTLNEKLKYQGKLIALLNQNLVDDKYLNQFLKHKIAYGASSPEEAIPVIVELLRQRFRGIAEINSILDEFDSDVVQAVNRFDFTDLKEAVPAKSINWSKVIDAVLLTTTNAALLASSTAIGGILGYEKEGPVGAALGAAIGASIGAAINLLISQIIKSPEAFQSPLLDQIGKARNFIVKRAQDDIKKTQQAVEEIAGLKEAIAKYPRVAQKMRDILSIAIPGEITARDVNNIVKMLDSALNDDVIKTLGRIGNIIFRIYVFAAKTNQAVKEFSLKIKNFVTGGSKVLASQITGGDAAIDVETVTSSIFGYSESLARYFESIENDIRRATGFIGNLLPEAAKTFSLELQTRLKLITNTVRDPAEISRLLENYDRYRKAVAASLVGEFANNAANLETVIAAYQKQFRFKFSTAPIKTLSQLFESISFVNKKIQNYVDGLAKTADQVRDMASKIEIDTSSKQIIFALGGLTNATNQGLGIAARLREIVPEANVVGLENPKFNNLFPKQSLVEAIRTLFESLGRGSNRQSVDIAAQMLAAQRAGLDVGAIGLSGGGSALREALAILQRIGEDISEIKVVTLGSPFGGLGRTVGAKVLDLVHFFDPFLLGRGRLGSPNRVILPGSGHNVDAYLKDSESAILKIRNFFTGQVTDAVEEARIFNEELANTIKKINKLGLGYKFSSIYTVAIEKLDEISEFIIKNAPDAVKPALKILSEIIKAPVKAMDAIATFFDDFIISTFLQRQKIIDAVNARYAKELAEIGAKYKIKLPSGFFDSIGLFIKGAFDKNIKPAVEEFSQLMGKSLAGINGFFVDGVLASSLGDDAVGKIIDKFIASANSSAKTVQKISQILADLRSGLIDLDGAIESINKLVSITDEGVVELVGGLKFGDKNANAIRQLIDDLNQLGSIESRQAAVKRFSSLLEDVTGRAKKAAQSVGRPFDDIFKQTSTSVKSFFGLIGQKIQRNTEGIFLRTQNAASNLWKTFLEVIDDIKTGYDRDLFRATVRLVARLSVLIFNFGKDLLAYIIKVFQAVSDLAPKLLKRLAGDFRLILDKAQDDLDALIAFITTRKIRLPLDQISEDLTSVGKIVEKMMGGTRSRVTSRIQEIINEFNSLTKLSDRIGFIDEALARLEELRPIAYTQELKDIINFYSKTLKALKETAGSSATLGKTLNEAKKAASELSEIFTRGGFITTEVNNLVKAFADLSLIDKIKQARGFREALEQVAKTLNDVDKELAEKLLGNLDSFIEQTKAARAAIEAFNGDPAIFAKSMDVYKDELDLIFAYSRKTFGDIVKESASAAGQIVTNFGTGFSRIGKSIFVLGQSIFTVIVNTISGGSKKIEKAMLDLVGIAKQASLDISQETLKALDDIEGTIKAGQFGKEVQNEIRFLFESLDSIPAKTEKAFSALDNQLSAMRFNIGEVIFDALTVFDVFSDFAVFTIVIAESISKVTDSLSGLNDALAVAESLGVAVNTGFIDKLGQSLLLNFGAAKEVVIESVAEAAKLEASINRIVSLFQGFEGNLRGELLRSIQDVGVALGGSFSDQQISDSLYNTLSAFPQYTKDAQALAEGTKILEAGLRLTAAAGGEADLNMRALAQTIIGFGLSAEDAGSAAAKLAAVQNQGITVLEEYNAKIGDLAGLATNLGISIDETLGVFAALTSTANTDRAAEGLRALFNALIKAPPPEALKEYNVELDRTILVTEGLLPYLEDINNQVNGNREAFRAIIGEATAFTTALKLIGADGERAAESTLAIASATEQTLRTMEAATQSGFLATTNKLNNNIQALSNELGTRFLDSFTDAIAALNHFVVALRNAPEAVKNFVAGVIGIQLGISRATSAIGELIVAFLKLLGIYAALRAFAQLGVFIQLIKALFDQKATLEAILPLLSKYLGFQVLLNEQGKLQLGLTVANAIATAKAGIATNTLMLATKSLAAVNALLNKSFALTRALLIGGPKAIWAGLLAAGQAMWRLVTGTKAAGVQMTAFSKQLVALIGNLATLGLAAIAIGAFSSAWKTATTDIGGAYKELDKLRRELKELDKSFEETTSSPAWKEFFNKIIDTPKAEGFSGFIDSIIIGMRELDRAVGKDPVQFDNIATNFEARAGSVLDAARKYTSELQSLSLSSLDVINNLSGLDPTQGLSTQSFTQLTSQIDMLTEKIKTMQNISEAIKNSPEVNTDEGIQALNLYTTSISQLQDILGRTKETMDRFGVNAETVLNSVANSAEELTTKFKQLSLGIQRDLIEGVINESQANARQLMNSIQEAEAQLNQYETSLASLQNQAQLLQASIQSGGSDDKIRSERDKLDEIEAKIKEIQSQSLDAEDRLLDLIGRRNEMISRLFPEVAEELETSYNQQNEIIEKALANREITEESYRRAKRINDKKLAADTIVALQNQIQQIQDAGINNPQVFAQLEAQIKEQQQSLIAIKKEEAFELNELDQARLEAQKSIAQELISIQEEEFARSAEIRSNEIQEKERHLSQLQKLAEQDPNNLDAKRNAVNAEIELVELRRQAEIKDLYERTVIQRQRIALELEAEKQKNKELKERRQKLWEELQLTQDQGSKELAKAAFDAATAELQANNLVIDGLQQRIVNYEEAYKSQGELINLSADQESAGLREASTHDLITNALDRRNRAYNRLKNTIEIERASISGDMARRQLEGEISTITNNRGPSGIERQDSIDQQRLAILNAEETILDLQKQRTEELAKGTKEGNMQAVLLKKQIEYQKDILDLEERKLRALQKQSQVVLTMSVKGALGGLDQMLSTIRELSGTEADRLESLKQTEMIAARTAEAYEKQLESMLRWFQLVGKSPAENEQIATLQKFIEHARAIETLAQRRIQLEKEVLQPIQQQTAELQFQSEINSLQQNIINSRVALIDREIENAKLRNATAEEILELEKERINLEAEANKITVKNSIAQLEIEKLALEIQKEETKLSLESGILSDAQIKLEKERMRSLERRIDLLSSNIGIQSQELQQINIYRDAQIKALDTEYKQQKISERQQEIEEKTLAVAEELNTVKEEQLETEEEITEEKEEQLTKEEKQLQAARRRITLLEREAELAGDLSSLKSEELDLQAESLEIELENLRLRSPDNLEQINQLEKKIADIRKDSERESINAAKEKIQYEIQLNELREKELRIQLKNDELSKEEKQLIRDEINYIKAKTANLEKSLSLRDKELEILDKVREKEQQLTAEEIKQNKLEEKRLELETKRLNEGLYSRRSEIIDNQIELLNIEIERLEKIGASTEAIAIVEEKREELARRRREIQAELAELQIANEIKSLELQIIEAEGNQEKINLLQKEIELLKETLKLREEITKAIKELNKASVTTPLIPQFSDLGPQFSDLGPVEESGIRLESRAIDPFTRIYTAEIGSIAQRFIDSNANLKKMFDDALAISPFDPARFTALKNASSAYYSEISKLSEQWKQLGKEANEYFNLIEDNSEASNFNQQQIELLEIRLEAEKALNGESKKALDLQQEINRLANSNEVYEAEKQVLEIKKEIAEIDQEITGNAIRGIVNKDLKDRKAYLEKLLLVEEDTVIAAKTLKKVREETLALEENRLTVLTEQDRLDRYSSLGDRRLTLLSAQDKLMQMQIEYLKEQGGRQEAIEQIEKRREELAQRRLVLEIKLEEIQARKDLLALNEEIEIAKEKGDREAIALLLEEKAIAEDILAIRKEILQFTSSTKTGEGKVLEAEDTRFLKFSQGGIAPGRGNRDTIPAMVTPGELILNYGQQKNVAAALTSKQQQVIIRTDNDKLSYELNRLANIAIQTGNTYTVVSQDPITDIMELEKQATKERIRSAGMAGR